MEDTRAETAGRESGAGGSEAVGGTLRDDALGPRLREAAGDALEELVAEHLGTLRPPQARQLLANPFVTQEMIEELARRRDLLTSREVARDLVRHGKTPLVLALRLIPGLLWRELVEVSVDVRVRPPIRRSAEQTVANRLPSLSLGEKMTLARRASAGLIHHLRNDPSPRVIGALLENPRLTEGLLAPLLRGRATPQVLKAIAEHRRWGMRYEVRNALCRNPRTPLEVALRALPYLKKQDAVAVATDRRLGSALRQRARLLSGKERV